MVKIEAVDGVADSIEVPSKDSYDLYVSKMETEQVPAALSILIGQVRGKIYEKRRTIPQI